MDRRTFLRTGIGVSTAAAAGLRLPLSAIAAEPSGEAKWRTFEVTTKVEVIKPSGVTRAWVPMPLMPDTDYQKSLGQSWTGNAANMRVYRDEKYGAGIFYAEWPAGEAAPVAEVDDALRHARPRRGSSNARQRPARGQEVLALELAPTKFIATDGVVRQTAREATKGAAHRRREGPRHLRVDRREHLPRPQDARLRHRRHQGACSRPGTSAASAPTSTRSSSAWPARSASPRATSTASAWPTRPSTRAWARAATSPRPSTAARSSTWPATAGCRWIPPTCASSSSRRTAGRR